MSDSSFDLEEFKGAWEQSRHLEQERTKHLVLFFSVTTGLTALVSYLLKDVANPIQPTTFVAASFVGVLLQGLALVIFAAIRRIGTARGMHERAMQYLRRKMESDATIREYWKCFSRRRFRWWSVQGSAEIMLHAFAALFAIGNTASIALLAVRLNWSVLFWAAVIPWLIVVFHIRLAVELERAEPPHDEWEFIEK